MKIAKDKIILSGCFIFNEKNELLLLYRKDHDYYETPGGKVEDDECQKPGFPTLEELKKTAVRELKEELGNKADFSEPEFFGSANFTIPDGRKAVANKFITKIISGMPEINEPQTFSGLAWLSLSTIKKEKVSPDLKLFMPKLEEWVEKAAKTKNRYVYK